MAMVRWVGRAIGLDVPDLRRDVPGSDRGVANWRSCSGACSAEARTTPTSAPH